MIHPSATVAPCVRLAERVEIHAGARIGVPGFGHTLEEDGTWTAKPHGYGVDIEDDVVIGANTVICRGSYRDTWIGRGTKIDGQVFIAHNVQIDEDCLIIAGAELSGSVVVGPGTIIGPRACVKEHVTIGEGALIGIGSVVIRDVPPGQVWAGSPARYLRDRRPGEAV